MPEITAVSIKDAGSIEFTGTSFQISGYTANATFGGVYADSVTVASDTSAVATWTKGVPVVKEATAPVLFFSKKDAFTVVPVTYDPAAAKAKADKEAADAALAKAKTEQDAANTATTKAKADQDAATAAEIKAKGELATADAAAAKAKTDLEAADAAAAKPCEPGLAAPDPSLR